MTTRTDEAMALYTRLMELSAHAMKVRDDYGSDDTEYEIDATDVLHNLGLSLELAEESITALSAARAEIARLRTWPGLMGIIDEVYPPDIVPTLADDPARDAGPRIVSLLRHLDAARAEVAVLMIAAEEHWERCDQNMPDIDGNYVDDEDRCPICDVFEATQPLTPQRDSAGDGEEEPV